MKIKYLFSIVVCSFLLVKIVNAQTGIFTKGTGDTIIITPGIPGNFETVINGDINSKGLRNDSNRVYVLQAGGIYYQNDGLNVNNPNGTLSIIGIVPAGKQRPVLVKQEVNSHAVTTNSLNCNLTIKNIQYESEDLQGAYPPLEQEWAITGNFHTLVAENNLFEFCDISLFGMQGVTQGAKAFLRGNYFRDYFNGKQWWAGRALYAKVPVDTLVYENNTSTGSGLLVLQQNSLTAFALINHNTIINSIKYPFLDASFLECYFTNNIIVNSNMAGDDSVNIIAAKTEDPNGLPAGITGVDTINCKLIQPVYLIDGKPNQDLIGINKIKWYAANNIIVSDTTKVFVDYITGIPNDGIANTASSYLTYPSEKKPPFRVVNVPETFVNSRAVNLAKEYKNIIISESNRIYNLPASALGFAQPTLDTAMANVFIQFNRSSLAYQVPGVAAPAAYPNAKNPSAYARFAFGDFDPATFPGPGGKEYPADSSTGGITAFTDLKENFAINDSLISSIDGLPVGSLIWLSTPVALDESTDTALIKSAFRAEAATKTTISAVNFATGATAVKVSNNPNPFNSATTFTITLSNPTHVKLTVYDLSGNVISTLLNEDMTDGSQNVEYTPARLSDGIYIYVLTTNETVVTGKMILQN